MHLAICLETETRRIAEFEQAEKRFHEDVKLLARRSEEAVSDLESKLKEGADPEARQTQAAAEAKAKETQLAEFVAVDIERA